MYTYVFNATECLFMRAWREDSCEVEQCVHFRCSLRANKHARRMAQKFLIGESCNAVHCIYALDKPQVSRIHQNSETVVYAFHWITAY